VAYTSKKRSILESIRNLMVDDHARFRSGVNGMLGSEPEFKVIGEAAWEKKPSQRTLNLRLDMILRMYRCRA
jgi:DNA-binding NarL/FixJ family response regulator